MKISFVVPAYNEEKILKSCLESIQREIAQNNFDTEVVVVNNASTDRTKEVALSVPGVRVVDEPKKGLVMARKAGFDATDGEIVANVDSDVMLTVGWLAYTMRSFEKDPTLVALSGPFIYCELSGLSRGLVKVFYMLGYLTHIINHKIFGVGAMLQGGNFVIRRDAFQKVGGFDTRISFYGEDTDVAKRLNTVGRVKWTFQLPVYSSARRLQEEGILRMGLTYATNYFWITFFGRPFTAAHTDHRS